MTKSNKDIMIAHVNDWMDSGLSIRDFADKIGITKGKFSYWVSKVKASTDLQNQQPQFIDLSPVTDRLKSVCNSPEKASVSSPKMTLSFPSGMVLKIYG